MSQVIGASLKRGTDIEKYASYQHCKCNLQLENVYATVDDLKSIVYKLQGYLNFVQRQLKIPEPRKEFLYLMAVNELPPIIQFVIELYGPELFIRRCNRAIELNKFRPKDLSLLDMVVYPDLFHIHGAFSTFVPELTEKRIQDKTPDEIRNLIVSKISNMTEVSEILTKEFLKALDSRTEFRKRLIGSHQPELFQWGQFLQGIADDISKRLGIKHEVLVGCVNDWGPSSGRSHDCLGNYLCAKKCTSQELSMIILNIANLSRVAARYGYDDFFTRFQLFVEVCSAFLHEFSHYLDDKIPNLGALGAQKSSVAKRYYDFSEGVYYDNPTEVCAHQIGNLLRRKMLERCFGS